MAKPNRASHDDPQNQNSTSTIASPQTPTDGKMVLRIRTRKSSLVKFKDDDDDDDDDESIPRSRKKAKTEKAGKLDSKKPKKPPTAFFYFLEDFRKEFQEQHPDVKSMRDVGKACGEKWKTMTYEEKVQYYDIATEKRAAFDRAMADYNKRMENREEQTSDEEI